MSTWYIESDRIFNDFLVEGFRTTAGFDVISEGEFATKFREYLRACRGGPVGLNIILDTSSALCVRSFLSLLRLAGPASLDGLRVIVLSTFESWGGKWPTSAIVNVDCAFRERVPLASAFDQYALENALQGAAAHLNVWLRIIGYGLFYGAGGLDLKHALMRLWKSTEQGSSTSSEDSPPLQCSQEAVIPIISITSFVGLVRGLTRGDEQSTEQFIPAVDCPVADEQSVVAPLAAVLRRMEIELNGEAVAADCAQAPAAASALWTCHLPFTRSPVTGNLLSDLQTVWAEFLRHNALQPLSILLAGPPRMGKSDAAAMVAQQLSVELITAESAVKFLFRKRDGSGVAAAVAERLSAAFTELKAAVDAKAAEGKKPAKGAPVPEDGVIDEAVFTPAFCQALPAELLHRCVSAQARLSQGCKRRGFVLDLWDGKIVTGESTLREALNSILPASEQDVAPLSVELVAELHCPASVPVERLVMSQGAQAKAKESQAAVKALEALMATYTNSLVAVDHQPAASTSSAAHLAQGLPGVAEILSVRTGASGAGATVCRVDCASASGGSADAIAATLKDAMLSARGGNIGWLPTSQDTTSASKDAPMAAILPAVALPPLADEAVGLSSLARNAAGSGTRSMAEQVAQLDPTRRSTLAARSEKLESFLTASVLPPLASGLVQIQREQPEDPILFLAQHLLQHSATTNKLAEDKARARFLELLHQGPL